MKGLLKKLLMKLVKHGLDELHKEIDKKVAEGDRSEASALASLTRERTLPPR